MRPALLRLLSRPSSLELLRFLIRTPAVGNVPVPKSPQCQSKRASQGRGYGSLTVATHEEEFYERKGVEGVDNEANDLKTPLVPLSPHTRTTPTEMLLGNSFLAAGYYGTWKRPTLWSAEDIEFESNIAAPELPERRRLIDQPKHQKDLQLFARLLDHRERRYGLEGIRMFWEAVKKRRIRLPTRDYRESKNVGLPAEKLWLSFLKLGFCDNQVLEELCVYADNLLDKTGRRWTRLYATIVQHFLVSGKGEEATAWHNRLLERHPPTAHSFRVLCHQTVHHRGDLKALKEIYRKNEHRNAYGEIIPTLCWQQNFKAAMDWHFWLLSLGDVPVNHKHAQALSRFLATYDRPNAVRVTQSLVAANAAFKIPTAQKDNVKISREIMNLIHSKIFNIPAKAYNDEYGARWFATSWVPLDLAVHSIHALGVQEIGPLSLQALCLRLEPDGTEPSLSAILQRLEQLQSIGISIGSSVFSRAVKYFAQNRMSSYLMDLLKSDQHPDALEDWKYLEHLLASYARIRDWNQYRRILAIRIISSKSPAAEAQNIWLRTQVTNRDFAAMQDSLDKMRLNGTIVKTATIAYILRSVLVPRQRGHRPQTQFGKPRDLDVAVATLKGIMDAGNLVPAVFWREIIRRFGQSGRQNELQELCIFLASKYGPNDKSHLEHTIVRRANLYKIPAQVDTRHPLHPLKVLFPVTLQKAIVEWGFIHALSSKGPSPHAQSRNVLVKRHDSEQSPTKQVTAGISLLKHLRQLGVHIDGRAVKKAILNRLIIYYCPGPGRSNRTQNRIARMYVPELRVMTRLIDDAMGTRTSESNLKKEIMSRGRTRLLKRDQKVMKLNTKRFKSRVVPSHHLLE